MTDDYFFQFYQHVKNSHKESKELLMLHISMLRLYLLAIEKEDIYITKYPLKLHIRTFFETVLSLIHIIRGIVCGIIGKPSDALILVLEPTHLKQMLGMEAYLSNYNPIFLTTKRSYISLLKKTFNTKRVVYIPMFFINPKWVKKQTLTKLYKEFNIQVSDEVLTYSCKIVNDQVNHYRYIQFILNILGKFHPFKIALVFNDLTITGRIISLALQNTLCKTCYVMHGLLSDEFIESLHIADEFFIFGEYTRPILVKRGINNHHIHTIGAPYLSYYRHAHTIENFKSTVVNEKSKDKSIALILLSGRGHTTSSKHHDMLIQALNEVIEQQQHSYYFIFKLHKKDDISYYEPLLKNKKIEFNFAIYTYDYFDGEESIFDWLSISDLIITGASTTALEAMYLKKPVITVDFLAEYEKETIYISNDATYHCRSKQELQHHLTYLKQNNFPIKTNGAKISSDYFSDEVVFHTFFLNKFKTLLQNRIEVSTHV